MVYTCLSFVGLGSFSSETEGLLREALK
jgi:hypothetical protein